MKLIVGKMNISFWLVAQMNLIGIPKTIRARDPPSGVSTKLYIQPIPNYSVLLKIILSKYH